MTENDTKTTQTDTTEAVAQFCDGCDALTPVEELTEYGSLLLCPSCR